MAKAPAIKDDEAPQHDHLGTTILEYSEDIAEASAPEPLPIGEYPATIETVEMRTSNTSGRDYIAIGLRVSRDDLPPDFDEEGAYPDGVMLNYNRLLAEDTQRARYNVKKFCQAIGAEMGKQIDASSWIGMSCRVSITHRSWEGEQQPNISRITALD
jgi:hypothetical protein